MAILITGAAGFIGSNLVKHFLNENRKVIAIDNLSLGKIENLVSVENNFNFAFHKIDLSDYDNLKYKFDEILNLNTIEEVWHLAANSDIPAGVSNIDIDYLNTFQTTFNLLKCMKFHNIKILYFASTSAIYGDLGDQNLVEDIGPLFPISNYGAMKLSSEAIISASVESFLDRAYIFRFPNVIGTPATHGVIFDFINKLKIDNSRLEVLGNGTQQKTYLHVDELIDAMLYISKISKDRINCFNIGNIDDGVTVKFIAESVVKSINPDAKIFFGEGNKGWVGDVPKFKYNINKLISLGWKPKLNSSQSIELAISQIIGKGL